MRFDTAAGAINWAIDSLTHRGEKVDTGHWQGVSTEGKPDLVTQEIINLQIEFPIPSPLGTDYPDANEQIKPNLPWAEAHFAERVSRVPSNPGVEYENWPWWQGQDELTKHSGIFTHTYQERFWPKHAGEYPVGRGIRYMLGDLDDVIDLLRGEPYTRQAYLPIFFPEDTGAVHGGRIPCTLGYHFLLRDGRLHVWYHIRSCDAVRHFRDDLYMACRLAHWVLAELVEHELRSDGPQIWGDVEPGTMHFTAYSFHVHMGDYHLL